MKLTAAATTATSTAISAAIPFVMATPRPVVVSKGNRSLVTGHSIHFPAY
jgi:hypothetical protein